eukprot:m.230000 g.230000  ORF g.230000 m.230000 type:complete len:139 (-) comp54263_c0_seq1:792-1208(-)
MYRATVLLRHLSSPTSVRAMSSTPIGPYSPFRIAGGFVYTSGQIPLDPATNALVPGGIKEQTAQVFANLAAVLASAGTSLDNVFKAMVFIKDMNQFAALNEAYTEGFGSNRPARSCVEVARLPKDCLVEIEVIATLPQ